MKSVAIHSELAAVASICNGNDTVKSLLLGFLNISHFGHEDISLIYNRILTLLKRNKPIPRLINFREDAALPESARILLKGKIRKLDNKQDALALIDILETYRKFRVFKESLLKSSDIIGESKVDTEELIKLWEDTLLAVKTADSGDTIVHIGKGSNSKELVKKIIKGEILEFIPTGIKPFDSENGGFRRSGLVIVAATTSGGKSAMAIQLLINMYLKGFNVSLVSLEMDREIVICRMMANLAEMKLSKITLGKMTDYDKRKVEMAWSSFEKFGRKNNCRYSIYTPNEDLLAREVLLRLKPYNFDVYIIDYASMLKEERDEQWKSLQAATRYGKIFAGNTNSVVIFLAQAGEEEIVRYSRAMKENADNVWSWVYSKTARETGIISVNQQKARNQRTFPFAMKADFDRMILKEWMEDKKDNKSKKGGSHEVHRKERRSEELD
jgi:replicative DNA helicase